MIYSDSVELLSGLHLVVLHGNGLSVSGRYALMARTPGLSPRELLAARQFNEYIARMNIESKNESRDPHSNQSEATAEAEELEAEERERLEHDAHSHTQSFFPGENHLHELDGL